LSDWTFHGGRLRQAEQRYSLAPRPWLDLSTGINPVPWSGAPAIDWHRLPDEGLLDDLEHRAAAYFGAKMRPLALPGTEFGLRGLASLGLPAPFAHVWPGYRTHAEALPGSTPIAFETIMEQARKGGTILLANPSNPDGRLIPPTDLLVLARELGDAGGWLVVDEAFMDAHEGFSLIPHLDGSEPVIVTRSFGKFFGLAGARLGFALGNYECLARWRASLGSWPLSAGALALGVAAYADAPWIAATRRALMERAAALDAVLHAHGFEPIGTCPQFRLIDCHADAVFERLARHGILTRPFDYNPRWLRLGVPAKDLERLDQALAHG